MSDLTKALKSKITALGISGIASVVVDGDNALVNEMKREFKNGMVNVYEDIKDAVGNLRNNCGDAVVITSGSYSPSASIAIAKSNVQIIGLSIDGMGADVSITGASDADEIFNVNANKVSIKGIRFNCYSTTKDGIVFGETAVGFYNSVENCIFNDGKVQINSNQLYDNPNIRIENCISNRPTTSFADVNSSFVIIRNNIIQCQSTVCAAAIEVGSTDAAPSRDDSIISNNIIAGNAVAAIGIKATGDNHVLAGNLLSECTDDLQGTYLAVRNYDEASGGTLLT